MTQIEVRDLQRGPIRVTKCPQPNACRSIDSSETDIHEVVGNKLKLLYMFICGHFGTRVVVDGVLHSIDILIKD